MQSIVTIWFLIYYKTRKKLNLSVKSKNKSWSFIYNYNYYCFKKHLYKKKLGNCAEEISI